MFEVNNKILFVRGSFKNPIIEFVVAFNAQNTTETEIIEDICFERLNYGNFTVDGLTGWFKARTAYYGEEYFVCYRRENFSAAAEEEKRTVKRAALPDGFASFGYTREDEYRIGGNKDDSREVPGVKYFRQRLGDAWEDIRTKMYENEVYEDIIRTGSLFNDDMYREYEEFRKMTRREETVYVSQQV